MQQAIPIISATAEHLVDRVFADAKKTVEWMRKDPEWFMEADTTEEGLEEETALMSYELPLMLMGQMIVYLFSVLETALSECLAVAAAARGVPEPPAPSGPKLEGYTRALSSVCGVDAGWSPETWRELRLWRKRRNSMVHGLDFSIDAAQRRSKFVLEDFWEAGELPSQALVQQLLDVASDLIPPRFAASPRFG